MTSLLERRVAEACARSSPAVAPLRGTLTRFEAAVQRLITCDVKSRHSRTHCRYPSCGLTGSMNKRMSPSPFTVGTRAEWIATTPSGEFVGLQAINCYRNLRVSPFMR
jgi:hypothetical protein